MDSLTNIVRNDYFITIVSLAAVAYVATLGPKLPESIVSLSDNIVVKFVVLFIIAFCISRKYDVALISALAILALVLGLQVYMPSTTSSESNVEKMTGGFQQNFQGRQAEVTIDNKGNFMENEPLNEKWTQQQTTPEGYTLDWPGYESTADVNDVPVPANSADSDSMDKIVAKNDSKDKPIEGQVIGVSNTDVSNLELVDN
jgi:hypothetical protein